VRFTQIASSADGTITALAENGCVYEFGNHQVFADNSILKKVRGWRQLGGVIGGEDTFRSEANRMEEMRIAADQKLSTEEAMSQYLSVKEVEGDQP